jgi:hypothetical protein
VAAEGAPFRSRWLDQVMQFATANGIYMMSTLEPAIYYLTTPNRRSQRRCGPRASTIQRERSTPTGGRERLERLGL